MRNFFKSIIFYLLPIAAVCQNPANLVFNTPQVLTADRYDRATNSIKLQTGFTYNAFSLGNYKLNLSIGDNPPYVSSFYDNAPGGFLCQNMPTYDPNKVVGETAGSFAVAPSGAALYNIPLYVAPGTNGVQPSLSIAYNSQSGHGSLGLGWKLDGLSSITRVGKVAFHDGTNGGVNLTATDVYAIDGMRLFLLSGTSYGDDGASYYTEADNFSTIVSHGAQGNGPAWLEVKDINGNTFEYGRSFGSTLSGIGDNTILTWYLNKVTDEFGNYSNYVYKQLNGETVIDYIEYTGNTAAGLNPYNTVSFEYIEAGDRNTFYIAGKEFRYSQLLKTIVCKTSGAQVKKYVLDYTWDKSTLLAKITEIDANSNELHPTTFCWDDPNDFSGIKGTQNAQLFSNPAEYVGLKSTIPADLNGDGFSDLVCVYPINGEYNVLKNNFVDNYGTTINDIAFSSIYNASNKFFLHGASYLTSNVVDENMDNRQEVYTVLKANAANTSYEIQKIEYPESSTGPVVSSVGTYTLSAPYNLLVRPTQFYYDKGDHNGDGLTDELRIDPENIILNSSTGNISFSIPTPNTIARAIEFDGDGRTDFITFEDAPPSNGTLINIKVYKNAGTSLSLLTSTSVSFPANGVFSRNTLQHLGVGDYNGDGKTDILYVTEQLDKMYIRYSSGTSFLSPVLVPEFTNLPMGRVYDITSTDINMDGKNDVIITDDANTTGTSTHNYFSYFSSGDHFFKGPSYAGYWQTVEKSILEVALYHYGHISWEELTSQSSTQTLPGNHGTRTIPVNYITKADFNGDGVFDMISVNNPTQDQVIANNMNGKRNLALHQVNTAMQKSLRIRYANINCELYIRSGSSREMIYAGTSNTYSFPLTVYKPSMYCVDHTIEESGFTQHFNTETKYLYQGAIFHNQGKGFLGFENVFAVDIQTRMGTTSSNTFNTTYFIPIETQMKTGKFNLATHSGLGAQLYVEDPARITSLSTFQMSVVPRYSRGFLVQMDSKTDRDYMGSQQSQYTYTYNLAAHGKIQSENVVYAWGTSPPIKTENVSYTYISNHGLYKPKTITRTNTQAGEPSYTRTEEFNYDASGHLINKINDPTFGPQSLNTTFSQFTPFGMAEKTTISAGDISPSTMEMKYDVTGRFVIKKTDPINYFEEFVYHPGFGNVLESKNVTGHVTKTEYDGLGRPIKTTHPNGTKDQYTYAWDDPADYFYDGSFRMGVFSVTQQSDGKPYDKKYYDGAGRVMRVETQGANGQIIYIDYKYHHTLSGVLTVPFGTLIEQTEPYFAGQTEFLITKHEYDPIFSRKEFEKTYLYNSGLYTYQNIFKKLSYSNLSTSSTYIKNVVTEEDQNGAKVIREVNVAGQNDVIKNQHGTVIETSVYEMTSNGNPKKVTLTNNQTAQTVITQMTYNSLGQQTSLIDPSSGTTNYQYNTIGQLLQQSDASGIFNYTYDLLGRVLTKTGSGSGITSYQYVTAGFGKGLIKKVNGPSVTTEYVYDNLNRPVEYKQTTGSTVMKTNYNYDAFGRLSDYTYPGGYSVKYVYNSMGFLERITNSSNQMIWERGTENALGMIKTYDYGNGITTQINRTNLHLLTSIDHGSVHKQEYTFNPLTGNLENRKFSNLVSGTVLEENFNYDAIDRLKKSEQVDPFMGTPIQTNNTTYDPIGNVTHKDDAGDYNYLNPAKPYTLSSITSPVGTISLNTLNCVYNDFHKISYINEISTTKEMFFTYGNNEERIKVEYKVGSANQYTRYYHENYDKQVSGTNVEEWNYINAPSGIAAVYHVVNGVGQLKYLLADHLSSPVLLTDNSQNIVGEFSFDSWGRRRNPGNWSYTSFTVPSFIRGFTSHEHIDEFGLINMNGRVYDPVLARFIQPDNYVQEAANLQNFNRYSYVLNNPLVHTDPSGEIIAFTQWGYEFWKRHSPIAFKINLHFNSETRGIGFEVSIGMPKRFPIAYRWHGGKTYYWRYYDNSYKGWETRWGAEVSLLSGSLSLSTTNFDMDGTKFDQKTSKLYIGIGPYFGMSYENDYFNPNVGSKIINLGIWMSETFGIDIADDPNSDKYRTASINFGIPGYLELNWQLFTGNPGDVANRQTYTDASGQAYYTTSSAGDNPDEFRAGLFNLNFLGFRIGINSEGVRHRKQNEMAHKPHNIPFFTVLDRRPRFYFGFNSTGTSGW